MPSCAYATVGKISAASSARASAMRFMWPPVDEVIVLRRGKHAENRGVGTAPTPLFSASPLNGSQAPVSGKHRRLLVCRVDGLHVRGIGPAVQVQRCHAQSREHAVDLLTVLSGV